MWHEEKSQHLLELPQHSHCRPVRSTTSPKRPSLRIDKNSPVCGRAEDETVESYEEKFGKWQQGLFEELREATALASEKTGSGMVMPTLWQQTAQDQPLGIEGLTDPGRTTMSRSARTLL